MFRVHKLVKYLGEFGYQPIVVTTDTNYAHKEDMKLLDEIPAHVEIHRTRYIEPTVRGVTMALSKRDRTFAGMEKESFIGATEQTTNAPPTLARQSRTKEALRGVYDWTRKNLLNIPDAYSTWYYTALPKCIELIKEHDIELFYTTASPYTVIKLGLALKEATGAKWVCDMRDALVYAQRSAAVEPHIFMYQRSLLGRAFDSADAITNTSTSYPMIFRDMYGDMNLDKHHFIPTGVDENVLEDAAQQEGLGLDVPYLIFSGEVLVEYRDFMFSILDRVIESPRFLDTGGKFVFVGSRSINEPMVRRFASNELLEHIVFVDHVHQSKLYRYLLDSNGAMIISGTTSHWSIAYAKLMDFLGLEIPTIALVPDPSEARMHLTKSGLGVFLGNSIEEDVSTIIGAFEHKLEATEIDKEYCSRFLAKRQVGDFADIFTYLTSAP